MKLLIFDIDGTLASMDGATFRAYAKAFHKIFGRDPITEGLSMHGRTDPLIFRECFENTGLTGDWRASYDVFKPLYLAELPASIRASVRARVHPGVRELLAELRQRPNEFALALGTGNMEAGARAKIGHFGLNDYFPVGGFGDLHLERHAILQDALDAACAHFREPFRANETWVIGDTEYDVRGARVLGMRTLGVATGGKYTTDMLAAVGADVVREDLSQTADVLELFAQ